MLAWKFCPNDIEESEYPQMKTSPDGETPISVAMSFPTPPPVVTQSRDPMFPLILAINTSLSLTLTICPPKSVSPTK